MGDFLAQVRGWSGFHSLADGGDRLYNKGRKFSRTGGVRSGRDDPGRRRLRVKLSLNPSMPSTSLRIRSLCRVWAY